MITNCTSGSVFTLWSKLQTVIFLKSCWHSFVSGSCQEQPRPGLSWRLIKKRDPVPVTQQLKTFTQLGPSNPEAALPYCKDLRRGNGREGEGGGRGDQVLLGNVWGPRMEQRIMTTMSSLVLTRCCPCPKSHVYLHPPGLMKKQDERMRVNTKYQQSTWRQAHMHALSSACNRANIHIQVCMNGSSGIFKPGP